MQGMWGLRIKIQRASGQLQLLSLRASVTIPQLRPDVAK